MHPTSRRPDDPSTIQNYKNETYRDKAREASGRRNSRLPVCLLAGDRAGMFEVALQAKTKNDVLQDV
jgi:hypothetical protein